MKDLPILFSGPMVRAMPPGPKTQTRRVWKMPRGCEWYAELGGEAEGWFVDPDQPWWLHVEECRCPYGRPGDRLWVRETFFAWGRWETRYSAKKGRDEWHFIDMTVESGRKYLYAADNKNYAANLGANQGRGLYPSWWKRPAIHMPRAASRITLEITGVRVERLQDISPDDCIAEGAWPIEKRELGRGHEAVAAFRTLWEGINGTGSWAVNPWVWVLDFKRLVQEGGAQ